MNSVTGGYCKVLLVISVCALLGTFFSQSPLCSYLDHRGLGWCSGRQHDWLACPGDWRTARLAGQL